MIGTRCSIFPTKEVGGKTIGTLTFSRNGIRIGFLNFELFISASQDKHQRIATTRGINTAFASYASKDRGRVLARVQGIEKLGVNVFMDVRNLKSNEEYPKRLLEQIEASDVLYLFWSRHAKNSIWVDREWRYGMDKKGIEFIDPVPLANPRKVLPPPELADHKHFDDWTLAYLEYEKSLSLWRRIASWLTGD